MTDDFEFDALESEVRRRFDTLDVSQEDPDAILDAMRPRLRRAQRNHRIATFAAATFVMVAAVVLGLAAFRGSDTGSVRITPPATHSPSVSTTTAPPDQGTPQVSNPDENGGSGQNDNGGSGQNDDATGGTQPEPSGTGAPSGGTAPEPVPVPTTTTPTTTTPTSTDTPYTSAGGAIVVHRSGSTISLGSSSPAAGYTPEVHDNGPTRVEVRFDNGQTEWRIRVDLVNGELQAETTQH